MEDREVVPGRTWLSLKERYLKVLRKNIRERTDTYDLDIDQLERLRYY